MHHKNSSTNQNYQAKQSKHGQNIYHPTNNDLAEHGFLEIYGMLTHIPDKKKFIAV